MKNFLTFIFICFFSFKTFAADTIKVGILHSLSGTLAISETTLKDTMLFL
ncbi:MAG: transporter substrate-binding protein, partial [Candidatus Puniceispirillales bacterium]